MKETIIILLSFLMFFMGLNLKISDLYSTLKAPKMVIIGLLLQYLLMPLLAYLLSILFLLEKDFLIGMILVGAASGGIASNVMCYLAKADLTLSITLTSISTLLSAFITPIIIQFYIGQIIFIDHFAIFLTLVKLIIIPVAAGLLINSFFENKILFFKKILPIIAKITIITIIALIIILNRHNLDKISYLLMICVMLHNILGFIFAYLISTIFTKNISQRRTIAIEVAMQNSGLAAILAIKYFSSLSAIQAVIFSIWHNISGFAFAIFARKNN